MVVSIRLLWRPMVLLDSLPLPQCAIALAGRWQAITHMACDGSNCPALLMQATFEGACPCARLKRVQDAVPCLACLKGLILSISAVPFPRCAPPPPSRLPTPCPILRQPVWCCCLDALRLHTRAPLEATRYNNARERKNKVGSRSGISIRQPDEPCSARER